MSDADGGPKQVSDPAYHSENHTAAQTCGWTKNALRGEGKCYKYIFYGIESHRCIQMTPVVKCNERCVFCWRDHAGHAYELGDVEWDDPAAARAVARAILDLRDVPPDRPGEDRSRRQLVGLGGGHYAPRFERVVRETDWAVGHLLADWGLTALDEVATDDRESTRRAVLDRVFRESKAAYALVDGDRPELEATVADLGYRPVGETWVRETSGVDLGFARAVERAVTTVADGLRFGVTAPGTGERVREGWTVETLPRDLLDEAFGIDREQTRTAVADTALAFETVEGGTRPTETVVLSEASDRERILGRLVDVLGARYDSLERRDGALLAREEVFDPDLARTLGVPEGPAFGRLSGGQPVEVDGEMIPPGAVTRERERRFPLR